MADTPASPPPALASATILLLRDGRAGLEVFMVQRHHRVDFATGAMVFPGGKVEPSDADPALLPRCTGAEALDEAARALRVAAVRETFEEAGVLLARSDDGSALVSGERLAGIRVRHGEALARHACDMGALVRAERLALALDLLVPFAHWITPTFMPRRFDTHFFLAAAPPDQLAAHDGHESVDSHWVSPAEAVAQAERRERTIIFPTLMNLKKLGRSGSVAEALEAARRGPVVTVLPKLVDTPRGPRMRLPAEAGYDLVEAPLEKVR